MHPGLDDNGNFIQTYSGIRFYFNDPRPEDIEIIDIAHALAHQCRYNGHSLWFYSVAEHSWLASHHVPHEDALAALMHDAAEAYIGDMARPLKRMIPAFTEYEKRIEAVIAEKFGYQFPFPESVKRVDNALLANEKEVLFLDDLKWNLPEPKIEKLELKLFDPPTAVNWFMDRFLALTASVEPIAISANKEKSLAVNYTK